MASCQALLDIWEPIIKPLSLSVCIIILDVDIFIWAQSVQSVALCLLALLSVSVTDKGVI